MARQTKQEKIDENRISEAYRLGCPGAVIPIMSIGKIFAFGEKCIAEGANDEQLRALIHAFVKKLEVA